MRLTNFMSRNGLYGIQRYNSIPPCFRFPRYHLLNNMLRRFLTCYKLQQMPLKSRVATKFHTSATNLHLRDPDEQRINTEQGIRIIRLVYKNFTTEFFQRRAEELLEWTSHELAQANFSDLSDHIEPSELERLQAAVNGFDESTRDWLKMHRYDTTSAHTGTFMYNSAQNYMDIALVSKGYHSRYSMFQYRKKKFACVCWFKLDLNKGFSAEKWPITISHIQYSQLFRTVL